MFILHAHLGCFHTYDIWCTPDMFDTLVRFVCICVNVIRVLWCAPKQGVLSACFICPTLVWYLWCESSQAELEVTV